jgi:hypothetical protein
VARGQIGVEVFNAKTRVNVVARMGIVELAQIIATVRVRVNTMHLNGRTLKFLLILIYLNFPYFFFYFQ